MKTKNDLNGCENRCGTSGTIFGIIVGIIVAILFSLGLTPLILNGIWVALGLGGAALVYIAVLAVIGSTDLFSSVRRCLIRNLKCLLTGTFGTIITSVVLVSIALEISSIIVSIFVGILAFFLIFLLASIISFLKCLVY